MRAGSLRHKITFERQSATQDSFGGVPDTWTSLGDRFASLEPMRGNEKEVQSGEISRLMVKLKVRYDSLTKTITPSDRITWNGSVFDIHAIENAHFKNRELILTVEEQ